MSLSRLSLSSGRSIELTELRLRSTYGTMLEGYPCRPINEMKIRGLLRTAESAFPGGPVHLVPPSREFPDLAPGGFGPVEVLPAVACVGAFRSTAVDPGRDPVLYRSALTIVWFQAVPDVPSGDSDQHPLCDVPWEELARDHEL
ncbi:hypothetical protein ACIHFE_20265 [Streptomyces sp. NPDC052396]|uniref:hypothetical protein n=1 Tax=Streptomyces sp. NPDC052396 TaxID=3365689 RepID=UPI0037CD63A0